jgi:hypothetical protein
MPAGRYQRGGSSHRAAARITYRKMRRPFPPGTAIVPHVWCQRVRLRVRRISPTRTPHLLIRNQKARNGQVIDLSNFLDVQRRTVQATFAPKTVVCEQGLVGARADAVISRPELAPDPRPRAVSGHQHVGERAGSPISMGAVCRPWRARQEVSPRTGSPRWCSRFALLGVLMGRQRGFD